MAKDEPAQDLREELARKTEWVAALERLLTEGPLEEGDIMERLLRSERDRVAWLHQHNIKAGQLQAVRAALNCTAEENTENKARALYHDHLDALARIAKLSSDLVDAQFAAVNWQGKAEELKRTHGASRLTL